MYVSAFESMRCRVVLPITFSFSLGDFALEVPVMSTESIPANFKEALSLRAAIPAPPEVVVAMCTIFMISISSQRPSQVAVIVHEVSRPNECSPSLHPSSIRGFACKVSVCESW